MNREAIQALYDTLMDKRTLYDKNFATMSMYDLCYTLRETQKQVAYLHKARRRNLGVFNDANMNKDQRRTMYALRIRQGKYQERELIKEIERREGSYSFEFVSEMLKNEEI